MSFLALRDEFVTVFDSIPLVRKCVAHDQEWGLGELKRVGAKATPLVFVTCQGAQEGSFSPPVATFDYWAVVLTQRGDVVRENERADNRPNVNTGGDVAAAIAAAIAKELMTRPFTHVEGRGPHKVQIGNMSDAANARQGRTVWGVSWKADSSLDVLSEPVMRRRLERIVTSWDHTGPDGRPDGEEDHRSRVEYV